MKKATSILFVLLTLLASLNPVVASHYCGGKLAEAKIVYGNGKADCGMNCTNTGPKNVEHEYVLNQVPCCSDNFAKLYAGEYSSVKVSHTLAAELNTFTSPGNTHMLPFVCKSCLTTDRPPPLLAEVSLPFIQVFII